MVDSAKTTCSLHEYGYVLEKGAKNLAPCMIITD